MKILVDVKDSNADFILKLLNQLPFTKATPVTAAKAEFIKELKESVDYMNKIKSGKAKGRPLQQLLDEL